MRRVFVFALTFAFCGVLVVGVWAQDAGQKTRELVAALDKNKYKNKEKRGFVAEVYEDIRNEPVLKRNPREYAGVYGNNNAGYQLTISVGPGGTVSGRGYDSDDAGKRNFILKGGRIEGALLTATKVFENGETKNLEAVFANRTVSLGTSAASIVSRSTIYGLGFIEFSGESEKKVFMELKK